MYEDVSQRELCVDMLKESYQIERDENQKFPLHDSICMLPKFISEKLSIGRISLAVIYVDGNC